jgi:hypothetical protein
MSDTTTETFLFWFVYNEVGVHPDDYDLDLSSASALEKTLKGEGLGEWEVPTEAVRDGNFTQFCTKVALNSILVNKELAFKKAMLSKDIKRLWEEYNPADAPEVDNALMNEVMPC